MILSMFPHLLDYGFLATFALRVSLGFVFLGFAYAMFSERHPNHIAFFEKLKLRPATIFLTIATGASFLIGLLLTVGAFTQATAFVAGIAMTLTAGVKIKHPEMLPRNGVNFYFILAIVSFVLVFLGPGAFAIDYPL